MNLDLTDEEAAAVLKELDGIIESDRYRLRTAASEEAAVALRAHSWCSRVVGNNRREMKMRTSVTTVLAAVLGLFLLAPPSLPAQADEGSLAGPLNDIIKYHERKMAAERARKTQVVFCEGKNGVEPCKNLISDEKEWTFFTHTVFPIGVNAFDQVSGTYRWKQGPLERRNVSLRRQDGEWYIVPR